MAKLPPKPTLPRKLVEQLRADLAGLRRALDSAKRAPRRPGAKRSRRQLRERIEEVVRELCPRGVPARSKANPNWKLLRRLRAALKRRRIQASDTTLLRALGRRRDVKKKPMK